MNEEEDCHSSHICKKVRSYKNILQDKQKKKITVFLSLPENTVFTVGYKKNEQCLEHGNADDCFYSV